MVIAKTGMKEKPKTCWGCDYTHDDRNGMTVCSMTKDSLYPMGVPKVLENCPLTEVDSLTEKEA